MGIADDLSALGDEPAAEIVRAELKVASRDRRIRDLEGAVRTLTKQLDTTPRDILAIVEKMNPQETGKRKLIGRFPAMSKVYALMTHIATGERLVSMTTLLPERAAPNLALGALLAWDTVVSGSVDISLDGLGAILGGDGRAGFLIEERHVARVVHFVVGHRSVCLVARLARFGQSPPRRFEGAAG
mgnify:CR=1 FL=1